MAHESIIRWWSIIHWYISVIAFQSLPVIEIFQSLLPNKPVPASGLRGLSSGANRRSTGQGFPHGQSTGNRATLTMRRQSKHPSNGTDQKTYNQKGRRQSTNNRVTNQQRQSFENRFDTNKQSTKPSVIANLSNTWQPNRILPRPKPSNTAKQPNKVNSTQHQGKGPFFRGRPTSHISSHIPPQVNQARTLKWRKYLEYVHYVTRN